MATASLTAKKTQFRSAVFVRHNDSWDDVTGPLRSISFSLVLSRQGLSGRLSISVPRPRARASGPAGSADMQAHGLVLSLRVCCRALGLGVSTKTLFQPEALDPTWILMLVRHRCRDGPAVVHSHVKARRSDANEKRAQRPPSQREWVARVGRGCGAGQGFPLASRGSAHWGSGCRMS